MVLDEREEGGRVNYERTMQDVEFLVDAMAMKMLATLEKEKEDEDGKD